MGTTAQQEQIVGEAAGVPFVALPPAGDAPAPLVVAWHMMSPPCTEVAMAAAVPMRGLRAWRVHFGLPMHGRRLPPGGYEEFFRLASEDNVLNVVEPVTEQVAQEFPAAVADLRSRLSIADGPIGIAGGSAGGAAAMEVLARGEVPIAAAALVNPVAQLTPVVAANERRYEVVYHWSARSRAVAERYDYVRRADELAADVLLVIGEQDDVAIREPAAALAKALGDRGEQVIIPGMAHELAEAPGIEAAPQTEHARAVDAELTKWFARRLSV
ncbi:prolyl oligopeptidase family serine peptidase [Amycolatopsis sp. NPDC059027]|uniref:prolyl oligopeptidase family serine peptidase n=1 Tax=Amycolatopsis sp. NPDC059027 TaxID=3346709 RepID=UPI00366C9E03